MLDRVVWSLLCLILGYLQSQDVSVCGVNTESSAEASISGLIGTDEVGGDTQRPCQSNSGERASVVSYRRLMATTERGT